MTVSGVLQDLHYLASITLKSGKVFALFVKSPTKVGSAVAATVSSGQCLAELEVRCTLSCAELLGGQG